MTIDTNTLRFEVQLNKMDNSQLVLVEYLLDRLEVAEKDAALKERVIDSLGSALNAAANERDALRAELAVLRSSMTFRTSLIGRIEAERDALQAKVEEMERQEPVKYEIRRKPRKDNTWSLWKQTYKGNIDRMPSLGACSDGLFDYEVRALYLAPCAQPAPSVPDLLESLRCACNYIDKLGGVSQQYRAMLAAAPSIPEGWKLVPIEPTPGMIDAAEYVDWGDADVRGVVSTHGTGC